MAPKLPTSQIFKGRACELKYRAYRFCLNKKQANLLLYLGVIFLKQEKITTYLKFARIQTLPLRTHQKQPLNSRYVDLSLRCRDARHLS